MKKAQFHPNEEKRLEALFKMNILDTKADPALDKLTKEAVEKLKIPMSTVSIIDRNLEWYKSKQGIDIQSTPRSTSFCGHALFSTNNVFVVEDTLKDERFSDNPSVIGKPFVRFYAGIALLDKSTDMPIGVFCVKDIKPRTFDKKDLATLIHLANCAEEILNQKFTTTTKKTGFNENLNNTDSMYENVSNMLKNLFGKK